jgi:hypothetical protein
MLQSDVSLTGSTAVCDKIQKSLGLLVTARLEVPGLDVGDAAHETRCSKGELPLESVI